MDELLKTVLLGNTVSAWAAAIGTVLAVWLVLVLARRLLARRMKGLAAKTATIIDDIVLDAVDQTRWYVYLAAGVGLGARLLTLPARLSWLLDRVILLVLFIQAGIWLSVILQSSLQRYAVRHGDEALPMASVFGVAGKIIIWTAAVLLIVQNLGVNVGALVTGLGIGGIAVALALQNILSDLFASLSIALDRPFAVGDFIVVDALQGTVEHVGLKTTRVRSLSGEQLVFSNTDLLKSRVRNYKRMEERRIELVIGVEYGTPLAQVQKLPGILQEAIAAQTLARFDRAHFKSFGDSALNFEAVYFVTDPAYAAFMDVQQAINLHLYERLEAEGVSFAFPTRTVWVKGEAALTAAGAGVPTAE